MKNENRSTRYLPIRDKIAECEAALERVHLIDAKVNQLIAVEKLLVAKRNMKNI